MSRRALFVEPVQDDSVNIAGWVFADLLLSLSVIFLATISFAVPGVTGDAATPINSVGQVLNIQDSKSQEKSPIEQGFNFYYSTFDKSQIESDLRAFFLRENLSRDSVGFRTSYCNRKIGLQCEIPAHPRFNRYGLSLNHRVGVQVPHYLHLNTRGSALATSLFL